MSSNIDSILASFSPAQQDAIKALIAQEAAKNAPPAPRQLTEAEQVALDLSIARDALQHSNGTLTALYRIIEACDKIAAKVYPAETAQESSTIDTTVTGSAV